MTRKEDRVADAMLELTLRKYKVAEKKGNTADMAVAVAWAHQDLACHRLATFHKIIGLNPKNPKLRKLKQMGETSKEFKRFLKQR